MISHISIRNYALIDKLNLPLSKGLSIITGETGAGKSILLGALSLVLGKRADVTAIRDNSKKCVVELVFDIQSYELKTFFVDNDLDYDVQTIVRREILTSGKSRAFINDTPVKLNILKELGHCLLDIHSQHQTLVLNSRDFQLSVLDTLAASEPDNFDEEPSVQYPEVRLGILDAVAGHGQLMEKYQSTFHKWNVLIKELALLKQQESEQRTEQDYRQYLLNELTEANIREGEEEETESNLKRLSNAEEIKEVLHTSASMLDSEGQSILPMLSEIRSLLNKASSDYSEISDLYSRLESSYIELKDVHAELEQLSDNTVYDTVEINRLDERLQLIHELKQKHQVVNDAALIETMQALQSQNDHTEGLSEKIKQVEEEQQALFEVLQESAKQLSQGRKHVVPLLEKHVKENLSQMGMPNAILKVDHVEEAQLGPNGCDRISFLFTANKGGEFRELAKVASGGELSRVMLCIKALVSHHSNLPTIIFDEIDTGVSGDIAGKIAKVMKQMSGRMQVISITHLPQIAASGDQHYKVYKFDHEGKTQSDVRLIEKEERVQELAKMLSGESITEAALANATELLNTI